VEVVQIAAKEQQWDVGEDKGFNFEWVCNHGIVVL